MSIPGVSGASRVASSTTETPASMPPGRRVTNAPEAEAGNGMTAQQAPPLRFPWLSRLSRELAPAAPQQPAFPSAPILGDNIDRSV